jgi:hypothetical protein
MDPCFADRVQTALSLFGIYEDLKDVVNGKSHLPGMDGYTDGEKLQLWFETYGESDPLIQSLLYLQGSFIYPLLWKKAPTKTALKTAVDFIYRC